MILTNVHYHNTMSYDWDGKHTKRMNILQSIAFGAVIVLACAFLTVAIGGI